MTHSRQRRSRLRKTTSVFVNAVALLRIAANACKRSQYPKLEDGDGTLNQSAVVCIVFSAAAIEAMVNECAGLFEWLRSDQILIGEDIPEPVRLLGSLLDAAEEDHASTRFKLSVFARVLAPSDEMAFSKLQREADCLMSTRNWIVHMQTMPDDSRPQHPLGQFPVQWLNRPRDGGSTNPLDLLASPSVAAWAIWIATDVAGAIAELISYGPLSSGFRLMAQEHSRLLRSASIARPIRPGAAGIDT